MKAGIDIGRSHVKIGVIDDRANIIEKAEIRLNNIDKKEIKDCAQNFIIDTIKEFEKRHDISFIGIAAPGIVENGIIKKSVNLGISSPYDLKSKLEQVLNIEIKIENDAKCAAICEFKQGSLKDEKNSLFFTLGTGVGFAVQVNGHLLKVPCEIGHNILIKDGRKCSCSKLGCIEQYCSMRAFKNDIKQELNLPKTTHGEQIKSIIQANKEDEKINKVIDEFTNNLCIVISNYVNLFGSKKIGIGGSFVYFDQIFLPILNEKINNSNLIFSEEKIKIVSASYGNDAGLKGATFI